MAAGKKITVTEVQAGLVDLMNAGYECRWGTRHTDDGIQSWRHPGGHEFLLVIDQRADTITAFSLQIAPLSALLKPLPEEKPAQSTLLSE